VIPCAQETGFLTPKLTISLHDEYQINIYLQGEAVQGIFLGYIMIVTMRMIIIIKSTEWMSGKRKKDAEVRGKFCKI
jgi:hypothetical protein